MKKILIFLAFIPFTLSSQNDSFDYGNTNDAKAICSLVQEDGPALISKTEDTNEDIIDESVLTEILSVIGASKRFRMQSCSNISNAVAISNDGIRYILYNNGFMSSFSVSDDWPNLFILAHEIGHHINGHVINVGYDFNHESPIRGETFVTKKIILTLITI